MRAAFAGHDEVALKPVFEKLGGRISYGKLKIFQAFQEREKQPVACPAPA